MKACMLGLASLAVSITACEAQVIRSVDGKTAVLPSQFSIGPDGIRYFVSGHKDPVFISWDRVDLKRLAQEEPKLEEARHEASLKDDRVFVTIEPPPNYFREFLWMPIHADFPVAWSRRTAERSYYQFRFAKTVEPNGTNTLQGEGLRQSESSESVRQRSRPPLDTCVEGLLMRLGADTDDSYRLLRDLRTTGNTLHEIALLFSYLERAYPNDLRVKKAADAWDVLCQTGPTSVDALRSMKDFVLYARSKS